MTISRLFFAAAIVASSAFCAESFAQPSSAGTPVTQGAAVPATASTTSSSQAHAVASHGNAAASTVKKPKAELTAANKDEAYHLPVERRAVQSYQNAVTPPPSGGEP